jgi:hypothetical protein
MFISLLGIPKEVALIVWSRSWSEELQGFAHIPSVQSTLDCNPDFQILETYWNSLGLVGYPSGSSWMLFSYYHATYSHFMIVKKQFRIFKKIWLKFRAVHCCIYWKLIDRSVFLAVVFINFTGTRFVHQITFTGTHTQAFKKGNTASIRE